MQRQRKLFDETCWKPSPCCASQRTSPHARCSEGSMAAPPFADPPKFPKNIPFSSSLHPPSLSTLRLSYKSSRCTPTPECQAKFVIRETVCEVTQDMHAGVTAVCFSAVDPSTAGWWGSSPAFTLARTWGAGHQRARLPWFCPEMQTQERGIAASSRHFV